MKSLDKFRNNTKAATAAAADALAREREANIKLAHKLAPLGALINRRITILEKMANSKKCLVTYEAENAHFYDHFGAATSAEPAVGNLSDFCNAYQREFIAERVVGAAKYQIAKLTAELNELEAEIASMVKDRDEDKIEILPLELKPD